MYLDVAGNKTFVATGGKPFDPSLPALVFLHGSGLDHRTWALQTRWFAFNGFAVIAPDLPGHSLSEGDPLTTIEDMGAWVWQLLDELGVEQVRLIGHSQGALVGLEAARQMPQRSQSLHVVAASEAIPVNPQLLELAHKNPVQAVRAMLSWGFGSRYLFGCSNVPGQSPIGIGTRIMAANPLAIDLQACDQYTAGADAAAALQIPAQLILAKADRMTPIKTGRSLADKLAGEVHIDELDCGHMIPMESPERCLACLRQAITALQTKGEA